MSILQQSKNWTIRLIRDNEGARVFIESQQISQNVEENILYATALDQLERERSLLACSGDNRETIFQLTMDGVRRARELTEAASMKNEEHG